MRLKGISVISTAGFLSMFLGFLGLLSGAGFSLYIWSTGGITVPFVEYTGLTEIQGIIIFPFAAAVACIMAGFVLGLLLALLINLSLKIVMGIEIKVEN